MQAILRRALMLLAMAVSVNALAGVERIARIQGNAPSKDPASIYDEAMRSPKSARFSADGSRLYINALEGGYTLVYSFPALKQLAVIEHEFGPESRGLFLNDEDTVFNYPYFNGKALASRNQFRGKPVESELTHQGRYLWVPYYRRSFDSNASSPSAMAIIDTRSHRIVRVMPTGPLPKYVVASHDNTRLVVAHWGDNTLGVIDISGNDPQRFHYVGHWTVEYQMDTRSMGTSRDHNCGFCLRGSLFSKDDKVLLVARMGGGGVAGFEVATGKYLGTVMDIPPNPRHMVLSRDGETLYVSGNASGLIGRYAMKDILAALYAAKGQRVEGVVQGQTVEVGYGARTIALSPDEQYLYAAVNRNSELVQIDVNRWKVVDRTAVAPFAVGLAVSPDGRYVVTTSQGHSETGGGNAVDIFAVKP